MKLRRLISSDLDSYYANRLRGLKESPSAFLTTFAEEQARGNSHFAKTLADPCDDRVIFGAVFDNQVVGTIGIFREEKPKTKHKAMIWGMYVDVEHRKSGLGNKLMDLALEHAREKMGVAAVYLTVESSNTRARMLYESKGFKVWGTEPKAICENGVFTNDDHMALVF